jgi:hypothetical protein
MNEARFPAAKVSRADTPAGLGRLLRIFVVPVLGFVGFFVILATGIPSDRILLLGLTIATSTLILTFVAVDRTLPRERRNLLLSIVSFAYFVFLVLPVFIFYLSDVGYHPDASPNPIPLTPRAVTQGMLAVLFGYVMMLLGFFTPLGNAAANFVPRMRREWSPLTALSVALVLIWAGWAVMVAGQLRLIPERAGSGVFGAISQGTTLGIGLIALCYMRYRSKAALLMLALVIPPTMFFYFFTSSKGAFLRPLVMIAIVHVLVTRKLRISWILGFIVLASLIYPVSMAYRHYMMGNRLTAIQVIVNPQRAFNLIGDIAENADPKEYLQQGLNSTAARLDGLGILSVIVRDAGNRVAYQNGWTLAYIPMSYIPRLLWPGKPRFTTGKFVTDNFGYPGVETSTGSTWLGELFFNLGWFAVIAGMAVLGVWFRFLQSSFLRMDSTIPAMLAGIVAILTIAPNVGGDLLAPTSGVVFNVAPIFAIDQLVRWFTPPPTRLPPPL